MNWNARNKLNILRFSKNKLPPSLVAHFLSCSHWRAHCNHHESHAHSRAHKPCHARGRPHYGGSPNLPSHCMLASKLTGVLPACFQVNQVRKPFSRVPQALYSSADCICSHIGIWVPYSWIMALFSYCQCARFTVFLFEIRGGSPESAGSDLRIELHMVMSSIARSMLAELAYIVLLVENRFLSWFAWKQAGITFRLRMLACICCCLCRDSICIQLPCLARQPSSVSYAVPVCM